MTSNNDRVREIARHGKLGIRTDRRGGGGGSMYLAVLAALMLSGGPAYQTESASKAQTTDVKTVAVCDKVRAILLVQEQVEESKKLDDARARVNVILPAAGLLWADRQNLARTLFQQAFDLATQWNVDNPVRTTREGMLLVTSTDLRMAVIQAITRYDREWGRRLLKSVVENDLKAASENEGTKSGRKNETASDFLSLARQLIDTDRAAAIELARDSFSYPAHPMLPTFLFQLAAVDQAAADALYQVTLSAYSDKDIDSALYLAIYPFGLSSVVGQPLSMMSYSSGSTFIPDPKSQQLYLRLLFDRAQRLLEPAGRGNPPAARPGSMPDAAQVYVALEQLEPSIARYQPALSESAMQLKSLLYSSMPPDARQRALGFLQGRRDWDNAFESFLQKADAAS